MSVTYYDIIHAVGNTLRSTANVKQTQVLEEITPGVPETPMLKIYASDGDTSNGGETDRATFDGTVRITRFVVEVEGYARQRSELGEDLLAQIRLMDAIDDRLTQQTRQPYFGLTAIKAFKWSWERTTFQFGDQTPGALYAGVSVEIELFVY